VPIFSGRDHTMDIRLGGNPPPAEREMKIKAKAEGFDTRDLNEAKALCVRVRQERLLVRGAVSN